MSDRAVVVKFLSGGPAGKNRGRWLRQFPGRRPEWGNCRFVLNEEAREYDWLVVYDDLPREQVGRFSLRVETLACPRARTILVTTEPSSIKPYGTDYLAQFGMVVTYQEPWAISHPNLVFSHCGEHWHYGVRLPEPTTYDELKSAPVPVKQGVLSTVCSSKKERHTLHYSRFAFTQQLVAAMPELAVYGRGVRPVLDKREAIDPYRYHIAIENQISPHYWSEKLADVFLGYALPIYGGCPNVGDYFPAESYIPIDIGDADAAIATIREAIATHQYEKRLPAILEGRRLVLDEYNLFALLQRLIRDRDPGPGGAEPGAKIYSRHALRRHRPLTAIRFLIEKMRWLARNVRHQAGGR